MACVGCGMQNPQLCIVIDFLAKMSRLAFFFLAGLEADSRT